ncbi:phospholipase D family protein [Rhodococcus qingshengii]|uniref:phospholipase D family protein n=1 Tax=Rhodococcus qingshengii TaxID=334542 RepID=UPI0036D8385C
MATTFHGPTPWPHITRAIRGQSPRYAAIAYLGHLAPELLPLRAGDLLIVNASTAAIRGHATSPAVLAYYLNRGVRILSSPTLHAKVIVTDRRAVIGSANASENSTLTNEAVIITDDPKVVADSLAFIKSIDETTDVDQIFIDNATREWEIGRGVPIPGVSGRIQNRDNAFLPTTAARMFIKQDSDHESDLGEDALPEGRPSWGSFESGPTVKYQLQALRLQRRCSIAYGDVIIRISPNGEALRSPAVVISKPERVINSSNQFQCILRTRTDLTDLPVTRAEKHLAEVGSPTARLRTDHFVRSSSIRSELLALWNL